MVDGAASQWALVTSGVLQGSLLGPLSFTIFINDLPHASNLGKVTTALYTDDTEMFNCIGLGEHCLALQTTLSNMEHWCKGNNICFKCIQMQSTKRYEKEGSLVLL